MDRPQISIVLPVYNGATFLQESIESCLTQTFPFWELIVVDDASTDGTPEIISRYTKLDPRIRSIRHDRNCKLPGALNSGFQKARGQYLTWTSNDNTYRPNALESMFKFLEANREVAMVYADYTVIDQEGAPVERRVVDLPADDTLHNWVGACFLYRREVYIKIGNYADDLFLAEDYDYWLRIRGKFRMGPLHQDLYCYRDHGASLTRQRAYAVKEAHIRAVERNIGVMNWLRPGALPKFYIDCASAALAVGDNEGVRRNALKAMADLRDPKDRAQAYWLLSQSYSLRSRLGLRLMCLVWSFILDPRRIKGSCCAIIHRMNGVSLQNALCANL